VKGRDRVDDPRVLRAADALPAGAAIVATVVSAAFVAGAGPVITFGATAVALAMLASLVGEGPSSSARARARR